MTEIRGLVADRVRIPFRRPFPTATGMWVERDAWILRLVDADGRVGLGEAVVEPADGEVAETILEALVREAVEGAADGRLPTFDDLEPTERPAERSTPRSKAPGSTWTRPGRDAEPDDDAWASTRRSRPWARRRGRGGQPVGRIRAS